MFLRFELRVLHQRMRTQEFCEAFPQRTGPVTMNDTPARFFRRFSFVKNFFSSFPGLPPRQSDHFDLPRRPPFARLWAPGNFSPLRCLTRPLPLAFAFSPLFFFHRHFH